MFLHILVSTLVAIVGSCRFLASALSAVLLMSHWSLTYARENHVNGFIVEDTSFILRMHTGDVVFKLFAGLELPHATKTLKDCLKTILLT